MKPEASIPASGAAKSGTNTVQGYSDRGTGVGGPHARSEAVPNTASERIEQIRTGLADLDVIEHGVTGQKGRYGCTQLGWILNMTRDLAWLLDHVDRLGTVLADEQPDVDGWEITATPRGPMVSHSTDADLRVLVADQGDPLPVGAVLAFIADQEGQSDA